MPLTVATSGPWWQHGTALCERQGPSPMRRRTAPLSKVSAAIGAARAQGVHSTRSQPAAALWRRRGPATAPPGPPRPRSPSGGTHGHGERTPGRPPGEARPDELQGGLASRPCGERKENARIRKAKRPLDGKGRFGPAAFGSEPGPGALWIRRGNKGARAHRGADEPPWVLSLERAPRRNATAIFSAGTNIDKSSK